MCAEAGQINTCRMTGSGVIVSYFTRLRCPVWFLNVLLSLNNNGLLFSYFKAADCKCSGIPKSYQFPMNRKMIGEEHLLPIVPHSDPLHLKYIGRQAHGMVHLYVDSTCACMQVYFHGEWKTKSKTNWSMCLQSQKILLLNNNPNV